ncbi:DUF5681 domain-containing protein [Methylobacterium oxalidis]|uniref:DUF5681 domain-containing protein n=1 Tax=Methylobacterium oxalidis TaxID=944322 RepID=A0A512J4B5_9HYPH|nr:DUF5681 domain-containing protein [Methylobacterium oxalidis]GEP04837.1 hypothetical protein MOX02_28750 [Methylobacterium oxalidis]GJE30529.1 hypothetical protein LDDCCGHA_0697 [Methylobacterium oxalidis]GLS63662.1 hypothetical protein GCM10007888_20430 [Methylobacterium oxalidis]
MKPGTFQKGQSGNPAGRPVGSRHRYTVLAEKLMSDDIEAITTSVLNAAKSGDMTAARLVLDRIAPIRRDRPVTFQLPPIETTADLPKATNALLQAVASGDLTPAEASDIGKAVDAHVRAIEAADLHQRLLRIEANQQ